MKTVKQTGSRDMPYVVGVILAGGRSKRMGRDKAGLSIDGKSLLENLFAKLKGMDPLINEVVVSGDYPDFPYISDFVRDKGPMGGLYSTLAVLKLKLPDSLLLMVPVDVPNVNRELVKKLISSMNAHDKEAAHFNGHALPAIFKVSDELLETVERIINENLDLSIRSLYSHLNTTSIDLKKSEETLLFNVNKPSEWETYRREFESQKKPPSLSN